MARIKLSGIQLPTLSKLNIDGELTLDAAAGTSGQILTSAGSGNTPTWSSSFNGITGLSSTTPLSLGTAAVGTATTAARADHVHPTATTVVATVSGTNSAELVRGNMADNDQFRILVGGTSTNTGFAEIATADDGTEPIHVRQYTGVFSTLVRTATLLDGSGNTSFPGSVSMTGALNVNTSGTGTLNLGDAQISKAPGSGFSFSSGIGSLTSLGIGTAANNASPLSVFFDTATKFNILRGAANQLADLIEFQTSSGTVLGGRNANAQIFSGSTDSLTTSTGGATTATSGTGTVATITTTSAHSLATGDRVTVAGVTPTGYNGTFIVTGTPTTTTFTYANTTTGSQTVAGTVRVDAQASVTSRSAATVGLLVRGATSQASNIFEVQNSSGTVLASVASNATFLINGIGVTTGDHRIGTNNYYTAALNVFARSVTEKGIALRANGTGQTANMIEVQSSAGTVIGGHNAVGQIFTGSTTPIITASGGTIQSIATGANPLVTMASAHGFAVGDLVTLAGTTGGTYNGTFVVASTPLTTTFTITSALTAGQAGTGGTASDPAQLSVTARSAGTIGQVIRGATSQAVDLIQTQTSGGTVNFGVDSVGSVFTAAIMGLDRQNAVVLGNSRNVGLNTGSGSYAGGAGVTFIGNAATAPTSNPTGGGILFVNAGALQYRGTSGSAATIVNADGTMAGYTLPTATSTALGGIELFSDTQQSVTANAVTATASRTYGLQLNAAGQAVVNVPWSDTDTNTFPTTWTWTGGTTAGPTASITGTSSTISVASVPVASASASGIVTTGAQEFAGIKTMTSPSITTSLTTSTTGTFSLVNTTATTVNFAGAATTLNIGTGSIAKTINLGTSSASTTTINIGTKDTSSSTINLQGPFINVGRETSSTGSITGVDTLITGAATSTSGASASVNGGNLKIKGGSANQEDEFNTASVRAGDVYIDGGSISTISGVQTKGRVFVGTETDTGSITIGRTGINTTVTGTLSNSGNTTTTGSLTRSALAGGGSTGATFDNSGNLVRTSSSERYKESIEDAEYLYSDVIALQPKTFRLKSEVEENENARVYGGFIAEEVDQLESLKPFVNYLTTENGDKVPDGIQYGEMVAALVSALKYQDAIIKSLETRIEALENN